MTTSNISQAIGLSISLSLLLLHRSHPPPPPLHTLHPDSAFVDRADIKQYIGLPPQQAIYWILAGCLGELMRSRIVEETVSPCAVCLTVSLALTQ